MMSQNFSYHLKNARGETIGLCLADGGDVVISIGDKDNNWQAIVIPFQSLKNVIEKLDSVKDDL